MSRIPSSGVAFGCRLALFVALAVVFAAPVARAIDLSPEIELSISGQSSVGERGLRLSDDLALSGACTLKYDPFTVEVAGVLMDQDDPSARLNYDVGVGVGRVLGAWSLGVRGASFDYDSRLALEDRHEAYLALQSDPARASRIRWRVSGSQAIDDDGAIYADIKFATTESLAQLADLDCELSLGWGDEAFARRQMAAIALEDGPPDEWMHAGAGVSFPFMFGRLDLVPSVNFSAVLNSAARDLLEEAGADREFWWFGFSAFVYLD